jgi:hypothetical protein
LQVFWKSFRKPADVRREVFWIMSDKAKILAVEDETPVAIMALLLRCAAFAGSVTVSACPAFFRGGANHL